MHAYGYMRTQWEEAVNSQNLEGGGIKNCLVIMTQSVLTGAVTP